MSSVIECLINVRASIEMLVIFSSFAVVLSNNKQVGQKISFIIQKMRAGGQKIQKAARFLNR